MLHHVLNYNTFQISYHRLRIDDNGDLVATRHAKPKHLLKRPLAWSYNVEVIEAMKRNGVDTLEVLYEDKIYSCPFPRFLKYAKRLNRGYGEQLYLCLYLWDFKRINEPAENGEIFSPFLGDNNEPAKERREQKVVQHPIFS